MKKEKSYGGYRKYIQLTSKIGIKLARFNLKNRWGNPLCAFLVAIVMNLMERRRYKYYIINAGKAKSVFRKTKKKHIFHKVERSKIYDTYVGLLNKTYFSCGFFNIVEHCQVLTEEQGNELLEVNVIREEGEHDPYFINKEFTYAPSSYDFGFNSKGEVVALDYGDFALGGYHNYCIHYLDYR